MTSFKDLIPVDANEHIIGVLSTVADTGPEGYKLVNGEGTILEWKTPSDGKLHAIYMPGVIVATSTETAGAISVTYTTGGVEHTATIDSGGHSSGTVSPTSGSSYTVDPGTTITV